MHLTLLAGKINNPPHAKKPGYRKVAGQCVTLTGYE